MKRLVLLAAPVALACVAAACGSSDTVKVTQLAAGSSQCPNGGVMISVNDGAPEIVCNGASGATGATGASGSSGSTGSTGSTGATGATGADGHSTLIDTVSLPPGDTNCPGGGEEIQSGLDNGANGGTADDGILQPGEITSTTYVCANGSQNIGSFNAPVGAAGDAGITLRGGDSDAGTGGNGGMFTATMQEGTEGGHIKLFATGRADPSFSFPSLPQLDPGENPVSLSGTVTIPTDTELLPDAGEGTLYVETGDDSYWLMTLGAPDGGPSPVTQLTIAADAVVTVDPIGEETQQAWVHVQGPLLNAGTIQADGAVGLYLNASNYWGAAGSSIVNDGADGAAAGGDDQPEGDGISSGGIDMVFGTFWNQGAIHANGGAGANGGNGGGVTIDSNNDVYGTPSYNTGAISANGGAGHSGNGGSGASIYFYALSDLDNSGAISAWGASGLNGGGGGYISLSAGRSNGSRNHGSLRNSGALDDHGGSVGACTQDGDSGINCNGGSGGGMSLVATGGTLVNSGSLISRGGSSANGSGGSGSEIDVGVSGCDYTDSSGNDNVIPSGDLVLSGGIDTSGGSGALGGGNGARVYLQQSPMQVPNGQEIILYGYSGIDVSGGNGASGGNAGCLKLANNYYYGYIGDRSLEGPEGFTDGPGGAVINYVPIRGVGGDGLDPNGGSGGSGANVSLYTQSQIFFSGVAYEQAINAAPIDVSGGNSAANAGSAGEISLGGMDGANNSGALSANGGAGTSPAPDADVGGYLSGNGGDIWIGADYGDATNSGVVELNGGAGGAQLSGGGGGELDMEAQQVTLSGTVSAHGGDASGANTMPGYGGYVWLQSAGGKLTDVTVPAPAGIDVAPGVASNGSTGIPNLGNVTIDGFSVTVSWTH